MTKDTPNIPDNLIIVAEEAYWEKAQQLGNKLHVDVMRQVQDAEKDQLALCINKEGLSLTGNGQVLRADLSQMLPRLHQGNLYGELLVKASKIKGIETPLTAIDATAGFGEDAILLAAAGFHVELYERDPVIAALLQDALERAAQTEKLSEVVSRMKVHAEDSVEALSHMETLPDVVLLDPMFPARQKSALIKKKFQLLQKLESPCADEERLLSAALNSHPRKVVIKRPLKGPFLAGRKPDYSLKGKAIRYDCIVIARQN